MIHISNKQLYLIFWLLLIIISIAGVVYAFVFLDTEQEQESTPESQQTEQATSLFPRYSSGTKLQTIQQDLSTALAKLDDVTLTTSCGVATDSYEAPECLTEQASIQCQQTKMNQWFSCLKTSTNDREHRQRIEQTQEYYAYVNSLTTQQGDVVGEVLYENAVLVHAYTNLYEQAKQTATHCKTDEQVQIALAENGCFDERKTEQEQIQCSIPEYAEQSECIEQVFSSEQQELRQQSIQRQYDIFDIRIE